MDRIKMKTLFTILLLASFRLMLFGQEVANTGIIYGRNHAFSLTAPEGWVLDNHSGVDQGLYAVFYPKGESWAGAETVMYANTSSLIEDTFDQLIQYDVENFKKDSPDVKITDGKDILVNEKVTAKVKYFLSQTEKSYEAVAYIDAGKTGVMIVMSSRSDKGFHDSLTAFEKLVKSYFFIANKVIIKNQ